jgi:hypothetical protein
LLVVIEAPGWAIDGERCHRPSPIRPAISVREVEGSPFEHLLFRRRQGRLARRRLTLR